VIEKLYKKINGSLTGLDDLIGAAAVVGTTTTPTSTTAPETTAPTSTTTPEATSTATPQPAATPETAPAETPKSEPTPTPAASEPAQQVSEESLKNAASRLRSTIKITGRVVDSSKTGIADVVVVLISPSGTVLAATTDNEGYYSFKVAPSQKTYRVIPSKDGYGFTPIDRTLPTLFEDLKQIDFVGSRP
jgi:hypothetical protein